MNRELLVDLTSRPRPYDGEDKDLAELHRLRRAGLVELAHVAPTGVRAQRQRMQWDATGLDRAQLPASLRMTRVWRLTRAGKALVQ